MDTNITIPNGLDPSVVNLARAIRHQESGGDYTRTGDAGSSLGAYQWNNQPNGKSIPLQKGELPSNWTADAKEVGLDPNDFSAHNQDMVAYQKIKKMKDEGNNVVDIAALWNGGDKNRQDPNYVTPSGLPSQKKDSYDVPAYAKAVNDYYQELKSKSGDTQQNGYVQVPDAPAPTPDATPQAQQEQPGLLQSLVRGIANPFMREGANLVNATQMIAGKNVDPNSSVNYGDYLGDAKPVGQEGDFTQRVKDAVGTGASMASNLVIPEGAGAIKAATIAGRIGKGAITGAKTGALGGSLYGSGQALQDNNGAVDVAGKGVIGGLLGGVTGGLLGGALSVPMAGKNFISPSDKFTVNKNLEGLNALEQKYTKLADAGGNDIRNQVANSNLLHDAVDSDGHINSENAQQQFTKEKITPYESAVSDNVKKEGVKLPLNYVQKQLQDTVLNSNLQGTQLERALNTVESDVKGFARRADADGYIPLDVVQSAKIGKTMPLNYSDLEKSIADKTIAGGLRSLVEDHTKSIDVKKINAELSQNYKVLNYLEQLNGKKVAGGRLGKYFAQTIGGMVGSHVGPFGGLVGAEVAGRVKGAQMAGTFGKGGKTQVVSEAMKKAAAKGKPNPTIHL